MNDLQRLLKLRGITMQRLADETGFGMHTVQKTVKGVRGVAGVQQAVADYLGVKVDQCFGPTSSVTLRRLIAQEIKRKAQVYERILTKEALGTSTLPSDQRAVNG